MLIQFPQTKVAHSECQRPSTAGCFIGIKHNADDIPSRRNCDTSRNELALRVHLNILRKPWTLYVERQKFWVTSRHDHFQDNFLLRGRKIKDVQVPS